MGTNLQGSPTQGVTQQPTAVNTTQTPPVSDEKLLEDLASQIKDLGNNGMVTSDTPVSQPDVTPQPVEPSLQEETVSQIIGPEQSVSLDSVQGDTPVESTSSTVLEPDITNTTDSVLPKSEPQPLPIEDLSNIQEASPINNLNPDGTLKGVVDNNLQDIIPGEKLPKALKRTPKKENLAKPLDDINEQEDALQIVSDTTEIDELLKYAILNNASDLHIAAGYPPIVRIDGELKEISDKVLTPEEVEDLILPILTDEKKELLEVNREIDLAYFHEGENSSRFRINAYYTKKNMAAAFRLIPSRVRSIDELLLPNMYHQFAQLKQGFILVTGPTGHGKSTTLAAILEEINTTRFCHIVTIEDPIEYVFEGKKALIDQREMNDDTHSWSIALRSALRQDPDVILVGEMRDYETIAAAITLAETGHLVFATLHTNSAAQTVDRMIDVFPNNQQAQIRLQLSNILEAIVAQRLIPLDQGGRRAVSEIMIANPAIKNMIREGKSHQIDNVIRTSSDIGMVSLERSLVSLVREGVISVQKAQEYAVFPEEVLRLLKS
jgi:twitching motility protein PilT